MVKDKYKISFVVRIFHLLPHRDAEGEGKRYSELFYLWGPLIILLLILFGMLCLWVYWNCRRKPATRKNLACLRLVTAALALLSIIVIALGFYGNEQLRKGGNNLSTSAPMREAKSQVKILKDDIRSNVFGAMVKLQHNVNTKYNITQQRKTHIVHSIKESREYLSKTAIDTSTMQKIAERLSLKSVDVEVTKYTFRVTIWISATTRWILTLLCLVIASITCILLLVGACCSEKHALIIVTFTVGVITIISSWFGISAHLSVSVALADFCIDPDAYFLSLQEENSFNDTCVLAIKEPFSKATKNATDNLKQAYRTANFAFTELSELGIFKNQELKQHVLSTIDGSTTTLIEIDETVDCLKIQNDYVHSVQALCSQALYGIAELLLCCLLIGFIFPVLVILASRLWRKISAPRGPCPGVSGGKNIPETCCLMPDPGVNIKKRLSRLQKEIGKRPKIRIGEFTNWAITRHSYNMLVCEPSTLHEVQIIVKAAKRLKLRVRCAGAGHSWSPLFTDVGHVLIRTVNLRRHDGKQIELQKIQGKNYVTVMSNVTVGDLMEFELKYGVHLPCNVILTEPTYGGVIGAGCHGVGWNLKALPDYVVKMRIVNSDGILKEYRIEDDLEMFRAVQTNLGLFGIIYDITMVLYNETKAETTNEFNHNIGNLFYNPTYMKDLVKRNDSVEIFWWPFNSASWGDVGEQLKNVIGKHEVLTRDEWDPKQDETWVRLVNFKGPNSTDVVGDFYYKFYNVLSFLESKAIQALDDFIIAFPEELTPAYSKMAFNFLKSSTKPTKVTQPLPNAVHYRANIALFAVRDMEFCFRCREDNFGDVASACQEAVELVQEYAEKGQFPLNVAMEMRFMADSSSYLCPAFIGNKVNGGPGHTVYIEVLSYTSTPLWKDFCTRLFERWKKYKPTVHWAKEWEILDDGVDYMKEVYSKQASKFLKQLDKSGADPTGVFLNSTLQKIFFPQRKYDVYTDPEEKKKRSQKNADIEMKRDV